MSQSVSPSPSDSSVGSAQNFSLSSVDGGASSIPLTPPPRANGPSGFSASRGARFNVRLSYPTGERRSHFYSVFFRRCWFPLCVLISLTCFRSSPVFLFGGPAWTALDHCGTISDPFIHGTTTSCPFLVPGSEVRVYCSLGSVVLFPARPTPPLEDLRPVSDMKKDELLIG